jgi:hypothetical protein
MSEKLRACTCCGAPVSSNARFCPHCGEPRPAVEPIDFAILFHLFGWLLGFVIFGVAILLHIFEVVPRWVDHWVNGGL